MRRTAAKKERKQNLCILLKEPDLKRIDTLAEYYHKQRGARVSAASVLRAVLRLAEEGEDFLKTFDAVLAEDRRRSKAD